MMVNSRFTFPCSNASKETRAEKASPLKTKAMSETEHAILAMSGGRGVKTQLADEEKATGQISLRKVTQSDEKKLISYLWGWWRADTAGPKKSRVIQDTVDGMIGYTTEDTADITKSWVLVFDGGETNHPPPSLTYVPDVPEALATVLREALVTELLEGRPISQAMRTVEEKLDQGEHLHGPSCAVVQDGFSHLLPLQLNPSSPVPIYKNKYIICVVWEKDDLGGCISEAEAFVGMMETKYGFRSVIHTIYDEALDIMLDKLRKVVEDVLKRCDLLVFHYGGHGVFDKGEYILAMHEPGTKVFAEMPFGPIGNLLKSCRVDLVILSDACDSEAAITRGRPNTIEGIAACKMDQVAIRVGDLSFTSGIIKILDEAVGDISIIEISKRLSVLNSVRYKDIARFERPEHLHRFIKGEMNGSIILQPSLINFHVSKPPSSISNRLDVGCPHGS